nr:hypothetical protein [uncultured Dongia sp.]
MTAVVRSLFGTIGYPPLKSDVVHIVNSPAVQVPMYCTGTPEEIILIASPGNFPWQFSYQLAHELSHMSARADLRFPRRDGLHWIEETLAETHSLIAMRRMAENPGPLQTGAITYDNELHRRHRDLPINKDWYAANADQLRTMESLSDLGQALARFLFDHVPHDRILADNRLLYELDIGTELSGFLASWIESGGDGPSVPSALAALI